MTRKEMLNWLYENCRTKESAIHYKVLKDKIGEQYYKELNQMQFVIRTYQNGEAYLYLSWLGKIYCEELLN